MKRLFTVLSCLATFGATGVVAQSVTQPKDVAAAIASSMRLPANRARDRYRHPAETLAFFSIKPTQTIVEFLPAGGWYTEILAPLVKGRGQYIALVPAAQVERTRNGLVEKTADYGTTQVATIDFKTGASSIPAASADVLVTFRNVHNLLMQQDPAVASRVFKAFYTALKPGGVLGIVDHRLPEEMDTAREKTSGYIKRSTVVRLAQEAGFKLAAESRINANPNDNHDHPEGVWTLPPTYRLKEIDRAKYAAIGESDRFTIKFVKGR